MDPVESGAPSGTRDTRQAPGAVPHSETLARVESSRSDGAPRSRPERARSSRSRMSQTRSTRDPETPLQEAILTEARRLLETEGYAALSTRRIASAVGCTATSIYLHFKSKDRLLIETLRYVTDEYSRAWQAALANSDPSPAEQLRALVAVDFNAPICETNKLAVWFAFWGESKSRPTYRKICAELDERYEEMLIGLCDQIISEGSYQGVDARTVATGLSAMSEGLWLDMLVTPKSMSAERASEICLAYLASAFPKHFGN